MKKSDNIYMDSLRYGASKMSTGISFKELKEHLLAIGWKEDKQFEDYFYYWFFTHFYFESAFNTLRVGNQAQVNQVLNDAKKWIDFKCPMTSEAYETFLDFEKLQQNRIDTKNAQKLAMYSIITSGALALIQIILQIYSNCCQK